MPHACDMNSNSKHQGKDETCQCGCRGFCSLWPLLECLRWAFEIGASMQRPHVRHDGVMFSQETGDLGRLEVAGGPLSQVLAVCEIRADWEALCDVMGLRRWQHNRYPCVICSCPRARWMDFSGVSLDSGPADHWEPSDYVDEIARCKIETLLYVQLACRFVSRFSC